LAKSASSSDVRKQVKGPRPKTFGRSDNLPPYRPQQVIPSAVVFLE